MTTDRSGRTLLIGLLLLFLAINIYRAGFRKEAGPFYLPPREGTVLVELGTGFPEAAVHQFIDGSSVLDVIKLTIRDRYRISREIDFANIPVESGRKIDLIINDRQIEGFSLEWMAAARRIALSIPLHPDRMSERDWPVLPGIGEKMAQRIENDRQLNGDFGDCAGLARVPGVGPARLNSWNQYFFKDSCRL